MRVPRQMVLRRRQWGRARADKQFPNLNGRPAEFVVQRINEVLGPEVAAMLSASGLNPNHRIRFLALASLCRNRRQEMGLSLKEASPRSKTACFRRLRGCPSIPTFSSWVWQIPLRVGGMRTAMSMRRSRAVEGSHDRGSWPATGLARRSRWIQ